MNKFEANQIVYVEAHEIQERFDAALSAESRVLCHAIDGAFAAHQEVDASIIKLPENKRAQQALCLGLLQKTINDIIGSLQLTRLGHVDLARGTLRGVIECFCTAILIHADQDIYKRYKDEKYSVNGSIEQIAKRNDLGLPTEATRQTKEVYEHLHKMTHPTARALAIQFSLAEGGYPLGGHFDEKKIEYYKSHLKDLETMARNVQGFLKIKFNSSDIAREQYA